MHDCTDSQGLGADLHFFNFTIFLWSKTISNSLRWMTSKWKKKRQSAFSPFYPRRVSSSWFLTTWFNHQTVFHVVPSSSWAENLYRHEILTSCLSVSPSWKRLQYTWASWRFSAGWRLKGPRHKSRHAELHRGLTEGTHVLPFVPSWLKVTLFDA